MNNNSGIRWRESRSDHIGVHSVKIAVWDACVKLRLTEMRVQLHNPDITREELLAILEDADKIRQDAVTRWRVIPQCGNWRLCALFDDGAT